MNEPLCHRGARLNQVSDQGKPCSGTKTMHMVSDMCLCEGPWEHPGSVLLSDCFHSLNYGLHAREGPELSGERWAPSKCSWTLKVAPFWQLDRHSLLLWLLTLSPPTKTELPRNLHLPWLMSQIAHHGHLSGENAFPSCLPKCLRANITVRKRLSLCF